MSVNRYDASTGELTNIASGQRTWVGTQAAYKAAKQAGTLPNNAIIAITDDEVDHNHYSTDEVETGMYWIDGKPIYRKVIDCGALPDTSTKYIPHGITNIHTLIKIYGTAKRPSDGYQIPLNFPDTTSADNNVFVLFTSTNIMIRTGVDRSAYTSSYAIIEYTKTTD